MAILLKPKMRTKGQAMLLTVLAIGGVLLGATSIAGLLTLYQIRASTDAAHSAQAIFAADTGVGWAEFDYYCGLGPVSKCVQSGEQPTPAFSAAANASVTVTCYDANNAPGPLCSNTSTAVTAVAKGQSLEAIRAFLLDLSSATGTVP